MLYSCPGPRKTAATVLPIQIGSHGIIKSFGENTGGVRRQTRQPQTGKQKTNRYPLAGSSQKEVATVFVFHLQDVSLGNLLTSSRFSTPFLRLSGRIKKRPFPFQESNLRIFKLC